VSPLQQIRWNAAWVAENIGNRTPSGFSRTCGAAWRTLGQKITVPNPFPFEKK